jgi:hypothetical protein
MERETPNIAVPTLIQWQQTWPSSGHWSAREGTFLGSGVTAMPAGLVCATTKEDMWRRTCSSLCCWNTC